MAAPKLAVAEIRFCPQRCQIVSNISETNFIRDSMKVRFFCGTSDYLEGKMDKHDFLRSVLRAESESTIIPEPNICLSLTIFLCSIELNTILLVPNKPITDLRMNFLFIFFFWSIFGHGRGPYGHIRIFPTYA